MGSSLGKTAAACCRRGQQDVRTSRDDTVHGEGGGEGDDGSGNSRVWSRDLERHFLGEFSFAAAQANEAMEDYGQVESGRHATFVGVYDGHGGPDASRFVANHLFSHFIRFARENGTISGEVLRSAFSATEEAFLAHVRRSHRQKPLIAASGSCCLVGVICGGTLYVANTGDSRAVIGYLGVSNRIIAEQLTMDHNASQEEVRHELQALHPDDSNIVVMRNGVWRVKGIIQVSRAIGDAYLKRSEFRFDKSVPRYNFSGPLYRPLLTAEPSIYTRPLHPGDMFLIFASDGLWEHVTNQEAAEMVYTHPRAGIARRLVRRAMDEGIRKVQLMYRALNNEATRPRRFFHDDITVIVLFLDRELPEGNSSTPELSFRGFEAVCASNFSLLPGNKSIKLA